MRVGWMRPSAMRRVSHLTFDLDESSRFSLSFYGKRPGMGMVLDKASMQFSLEETDYRDDTLEAYERLIRDAMAATTRSSPAPATWSASGKSRRRCWRTRPRSNRTRRGPGGRPRSAA